jgi:hypothetical protein
MKISDETRSVLQNFSGFFNSMIVYKGRAQRTNPVSKSLLAEAVVEEDFPVEFGIFDLQTFLQVSATYNSPEYDITDKEIVIHEGSKRSTYICCDTGSMSKKLIPPEKKLALPSVDVEFELTSEKFADIAKLCSILQVGYISLTGDGKNIMVGTHNDKDGHSHLHTDVVGTTDRQFKLLINMDNMRVLPHAYKVSISKNLLAQFKSQNMDLTYTFPCDKQSVFHD